MILFESKSYLVEYNQTDNRLYFYKYKGENTPMYYMGNRHIMDLVDIIEQNNEKEGL